jgi:hypothetical protein
VQVSVIISLDASSRESKDIYRRPNWIRDERAGKGGQSQSQ